MDWRLVRSCQDLDVLDDGDSRGLQGLKRTETLLRSKESEETSEDGKGLIPAQQLRMTSEVESGVRRAVRHSGGCASRRWPRLT